MEGERKEEQKKELKWHTLPFRFGDFHDFTANGHL